MQFCTPTLEEPALQRIIAGSRRLIADGRAREEVGAMCQVYAGQLPESYEPVTRRVRLSGHSTSIRLERSFWDVLDGMAAREGMTTAAFVSRLHDETQEIQGATRNFASLLRCACLIEARRGGTAALSVAAE